MATNRRQFIQSSLTALGLLPVTACVSQSGHTEQRVVVVGGGFAGATCARYLKQFDPNLQVTLIERKPTYTACPLSNMVVGGYRSIDKQQFSYRGLQARGINVVFDEAIAIDTDAQTVTTASTDQYPYDRLVVAPGIQMRWNAIEGYNAAATQTMPHAWQAGQQTLLLRKQLASMPDGGLVMISAPAGPYRCPPGPYERASLIAAYLKQHKPKSKLLLLDSKDAFSKKPLFMQAWQTLYGNSIEWQGLSDGAAVNAVDAKTNTVFTDFDQFKADVANIIPPQQAGEIAHKAGLSDSSGWCPIEPISFESKLVSNVHVIGDAAIANAMPKSAFAANAQAKLCAVQIVKLLNEQPLVSAKLINTCYSLVAPNYGISVADVFEPSAQSWQQIKPAGGVSDMAASDEIRAKEASYALSWFDSITQEVFG